MLRPPPPLPAPDLESALTRSGALGLGFLTVRPVRSPLAGWELLRGDFNSCVLCRSSTAGAGHSFCPALQVHVKSEVLAVKLSQEINYAKSLYYEQQLMLRLSENQEQLELDS